jgi:DNA-binding XRE family transcriptional regulator
MYRCYLLRNGRVAWAEDLDCHTTDEARACAQALLKSLPQGDGSTGIEVWKGATLVHRDECQAGQAWKPGPIVSPFETAESTIYSTWRPTTARPIGMSAMAQQHLSAKQARYTGSAAKDLKRRGNMAQRMPLLSDAEIDSYLAAPTPLAFWRKHRCLTQERLAMSAGISQPDIAQIENGQKEASVAIYTKLARYLGVHIDDLVVD